MPYSNSKLLSLCHTHIHTPLHRKFGGEEWNRLHTGHNFRWVPAGNSSYRTHPLILPSPLGAMYAHSTWRNVKEPRSPPLIFTTTATVVDPNCSHWHHWTLIISLCAYSTKFPAVISLRFVSTSRTLVRGRMLLTRFLQLRIQALHWIQLARAMEEWQDIVNTATTGEKFLDWLSDY
jgi:hypothetical protein